jgi:anaerobic ribonucleoside-triphosphate reductase
VLQIVTEKRFKCMGCHSFINDINDYPHIIYKDREKTIPFCTECGLEMTKLCKTDHPCVCVTDIHSGIRYCPECGEPVCPCGSSDCVGVSRVTGYLSDVSGWGRGKRAELKDRNRYNIGI